MKQKNTKRKALANIQSIGEKLDAWYFPLAWIHPNLIEKTIPNSLQSNKIKPARIYQKARQYFLPRLAQYIYTQEHGCIGFTWQEALHITHLTLRL